MHVRTIIEFFQFWAFLYSFLGKPKPFKMNHEFKESLEKQLIKSYLKIKLDPNQILKANQGLSIAFIKVFEGCYNQNGEKM